MKARFVRLTLMVVVCGLVPGFVYPARAADPISMEVGSPLMIRSKPFSVAARVGRWFPIAVTLSNTGDAVQGRLTLRLVGDIESGTPNSEFYTDVDLPANASRKRVWLYGRLERQDAGEIQVTFEGRGLRGLKFSGRIQVLEPTTHSVLTISDVDEKLTYLTGLRGPGLEVAEEKQVMPGVPAPANAPDLVTPLGTSHELVPSRWIGLEAIDLVVLHDFPHTSLTPAQLSALRGYVAGGGSILALGGTDWQRLAQSPLADLWPMTPTSSGTASAREVEFLVEKYAQSKHLTAADRLGGAPVVFTRGKLREPSSKERTFQELNWQPPILLRRNVGAGQVLFLAIDPTKPPFLGWSGNTRLWREVFSLAPRVPRMEAIDASSDNDYSSYPQAGLDDGTSADSPLTSALLQALASAKQLKTPPVSFIAWFLALYVFFLVPVNYCVLRYFDKRELAWITIPVIVVAFSVMSYAAALKIKGNDILMRQVNLVQGSQGTGTARADAMLWLFSPRKTTYDVSSKDPQMAVADYVDSEHASSSTGTILQPDEGKSFTLEDAAINMWDSRSFVGTSVVNIGRGISLKRDWNGRKVVLQNNTDRDLQGAVLAGNSRIVTIGEIKKGSTAAPRTAEDTDANPAQLTDNIATRSRLEDILPPEERDNFRNIGKALLNNAIGSKYARSRRGPIFVAWSLEPAAPLSIGYDEARARSLSLYVFRLQDDDLLWRFMQQVSLKPRNGTAAPAKGSGPGVSGGSPGSR